MQILNRTSPTGGTKNAPHTMKFFLTEVMK